MPPHIRPMNLGSTIKALRERHGWSQEELGWRVNSSAANISRIETGKYRPGEDVLESLAQVFGIRVSELFALAEGAPGSQVVHLPDQAEALLLAHFRAMSDERRLLLLQVGAVFARGDD